MKRIERNANLRKRIIFPLLIWGIVFVPFVFIDSQYDVIVIFIAIISFPLISIYGLLKGKLLLKRVPGHFSSRVFFALNILILLCAIFLIFLITYKDLR